MIIRAEGLSRVFGSGETAVHALTDATLEVAAGELVVLRGPSGSGKTTLLNLLGGLDRPTAGRVLLGDRDLTEMGEDELARVRQVELGYVFQSFGLIPVLSAAENVEVPMRIVGMDPAARDERVRALLELVGLAKHAEQRPYELSGGQQQRVGIARALANRPGLLIADEPTGQLDSGTAATMMDLIASLVHTEGVGAIVSTHDPRMAERADRVLEIHDGHLSRHGRHVADAS
ncbi:ABC transporter ATP-binding protein [Leifsonia sp. H3M29-4]|uniref:ABC transporter ATP-binding protein n=1 Tax=Salinibacterium metalliresistens TaxID=3031321 RepID=UPI0023DAA162|nr:ABC transporter ATP-binding protein [Salinibacterium metalliresistens]MDF1478083.1 ABC transporter ATP-binding protein [Salinibacterium metalliresistens]